MDRVLYGLGRASLWLGRLGIPFLPRNKIALLSLSFGNIDSLAHAPLSSLRELLGERAARRLKKWLDKQLSKKPPKKILSTDKLFITGRAEGARWEVIINDRSVLLPSAQFAMLVELAVLKKISPRDYTPKLPLSGGNPRTNILRLKNSLGPFLRSPARIFTNNAKGGYRLEIPPKNIRFLKDELKNHRLRKIREIVRRLG
jgi:hypothetical protein